MKKPILSALSAMLVLLSAGCFRAEEQVAVYHIPAMTSPAAESLLRARLKGLPGIENISADLQANTLTVTYQSSTIRKINIEETIAFSGFAVNNRPANPKAQLPKGLE